MTAVTRSRADLAHALDGLPRPLGLVPTMGALHAGHRSLMQHARRACGSVVVSIFVNPLQFGPTEDLAKYPRTLEVDLAMCEAERVDVVWAPAVGDVYPDGPAQVRIDPGPLGSVLEGAGRPTHFAGMLTVVAKLINVVRPAVGFFGEKDYQQLVLIARMVRDLELGVEVVGVPTVREADGLALSSRNLFLSPADRVRALALSRALLAGRETGEAAKSVPGSVAGSVAESVVAAACRVLADADVVPDYLELRGADLGHPPLHGVARLLVAARLGTTRLIDNLEVNL